MTAEEIELVVSEALIEGKKVSDVNNDISLGDTVIIYLLSKILLALTEA